MAVYQDEIPDMLVATQPLFERRRYVDLSQTLQRHVVTNRVYKGAQFGVDGGTSLKWNVKKNYGSSYQRVGVGPVLHAHPEDRQVQASVEWSACAVTAAWLEDQIDFQGKSETEIVDILSVEYLSMYQDYLNGKEADLWSTPTSSTQNPRRAFGIPFWVQKASSGTAAAGFNGGDPSGFSSGAAGISSSTVTQWKNQNAGYSTVDHTDALPKMSEMIEKSYFEPPKAYPQLIDSQPRFVIYTTFPFWEAMQQLQTHSNDNLGHDVGKFYDTVMFKGIPVTWVPALTNSSFSTVDTQHPVYGIDWSVLKWFYKKGWDARMIGPKELDNQPTARVLYMLSWGNWRCLDRRQMWVMHTTTFAQ
jgi:hypothetical protein